MESLQKVLAFAESMQKHANKEHDRIAALCCDFGDISRRRQILGEYTAAAQAYGNIVNLVKYEMAHQTPVAV